MKLTEAIDRTMKGTNERYPKEMEERPSNVRKARLLRHFKVGTESPDAYLLATAP